MIINVVHSYSVTVKLNYWINRSFCKVVGVVGGYTLLQNKDAWLYLGIILVIYTAKTNIRKLQYTKMEFLCTDKPIIHFCTEQRKGVRLNGLGGAVVAIPQCLQMRGPLTDITIIFTWTHLHSSAVRGNCINEFRQQQSAPTAFLNFQITCETQVLMPCQ